jgi:hypothetical protein
MKKLSTKRLQQTFSSSTNHNNSRVTGSVANTFKNKTTHNTTMKQTCYMFCPNPLLLTVFLPNVFLARHRHNNEVVASNHGGQNIEFSPDEKFEQTPYNAFTPLPNSTDKE